MDATTDVWTALGLADAGGLRLVGESSPAALASPLAVGPCAVASVAACLVAAAELARARTGHRPDLVLDTAHVTAAMRSEAWLRDPVGQGIGGFAPLSRFWPAADGWVRTHANYPWHRRALLAALLTESALHIEDAMHIEDVPNMEDASDAKAEGRLADAIAALPAAEVEHRVYAAGGLAVAARTADQWQAGDGKHGETLPLVAFTPLGTGGRAMPPGPLPASGLRVLDLTRVIAGPVGTRMLGALGADVLRLDDPNRPELPLHTVDGVIGKASARLDAGTAQGREILHHLVGEADVVVTGYRPGALRRLGLDPEEIAERHPGTVVATLSAWGTRGPWGQRRGFDSLVQVATGIGWATSTDGARPGALPCQLLDHATGYLLAAGVLTALARRATTGEVNHVSVALARTARWLLDQGIDPTAPAAASQPEAEVAVYRTDLGNGWSGISPPGRLDGRPLSWPALPPAYGQAPTAWRDRA